MGQVMEAAGSLAQGPIETCPEAHATHFTMHGATFRMLLREDSQRFPEAALAIVSGPAPDDVLGLAADRLKRELDPEGTLNAPVPEV